MSRSRSSKRWLSEHISDEYVKLARTQGYRSRAVFKLKELNQRDRFLTAGALILDLGASPGSWSQYALEQVGKKGQIIAIDIIPFVPLPGITFIQGNFEEKQVLDQLKAELNDNRVDVVLSDIAPNMSGHRSIDQARGMSLAESAMEVACDVLKPGGIFVTKLFQGPDVDAYIRNARQWFTALSVRKPKASRDRSPEVYLVGRLKDTSN